MTQKRRYYERQGFIIGSVSCIIQFLYSGFCDIVGISVSYIQSDFQLGNTMAGLFPAVVFIGFLFLPAPVIALANKIGCRKVALYGMGLTVLGMFIPLGCIACWAALSLLHCWGWEILPCKLL